MNSRRDGAGFLTFVPCCSPCGRSVDSHQKKAARGRCLDLPRECATPPILRCLHEQHAFWGRSGTVGGQPQYPSNTHGDRQVSRSGVPCTPLNALSFADAAASGATYR
eukprot:scaffold2004_cov420-Prasinococcus_capsulatus_cf.AAC.21